MGQMVTNEANVRMGQMGQIRTGFKVLKCGHCAGRGFIQVRDDVEDRVKDVVWEALGKYRITKAQLEGEGRTVHLVNARRYVAQNLREMGLQLKAIGLVLGGRDHSTVINLLKRSEEPGKFRG